MNEKTGVGRVFDAASDALKQSTKFVCGRMRPGCTEVGVRDELSVFQHFSCGRVENSIVDGEEILGKMTTR